MDSLRRIARWARTHLWHGIGLVVSVTILSAQSNIEVDGLGWPANRRLDQHLSFLLGFNKDEAATLDSAILEDAAFLLLEQMRRRGYLQPRIRASFSGSGWSGDAEWQFPYAVQLPIDFRSESVIYEVLPGRLYFYDAVSIRGLGHVEALKDVERFFLPGGSLITRKKDLIHTPENFEQRKNRLFAALNELGYIEARIEEESVTIDATTGAVQIELAIETGPVYWVGPVTFELVDGPSDWPEPLELSEGMRFSPEWLREARLTLLHAANGAGYPDAKVRSSLGKPYLDQDKVLQPVHFELSPGPVVSLAGVRFEGDPHTRRSVLQGQVNLESGALLDPRETDRARRRLMRLGIFRQVELDYDPQPDGSREAIYRLTPDTRKELQVLAGWGSYEQARAGFRWTHRNPRGRAHQYTLLAKQSIKATLLEGDYQVPQLLNTDLVGYSEAEYISREEIGYDRSRQGGLLGISRLLEASGVRLALEYGWFIEESKGIDGSGLTVDGRAQVASLSLSASLDRRDSFLLPTTGYNLFASVKSANRALGGSVNFQRIEMGGGYHYPVSESTILHLGLKGALLVGSENNIPFNERFFPGGENSVRGYQRGEASPLDANGDPVGVESFWLANFEIEQRVLSDFSVVGFIDSVGFSSSEGLSGEGDTLTSLGLGLRYQTVVGPVRVEYGHNLNPRVEDPSGTLHFSIGFPF